MMISRMKLILQFQRRKSSLDGHTPQSQSPRGTHTQEHTWSFNEQDQRRRASIGAAHDLIHNLISSEDRWSSHMPLIRINCPHTLSELHALGNLAQPEGVAACRKLIRVPVIHEALGLFIWTQLASPACRFNSADNMASEATEDDIRPRLTEEE